jgi:hypothetical protein
VCFDAGGTEVMRLGLDPARGEHELLIDDFATVVRETSVDFIRQAGVSARKTQQRLASSYGGFFGMLVVLFLIGVSAFAVSIVSAVRDDVVLAVTFTGLSAVSFVTVFLTRPLRLMGEAGPRAAWVQAVITTFWTKLAYFSDPTTVVAQLQEAQSSLRDEMTHYLAAARAGDSAADSDMQRAQEADVPPASPPAPTSSPSQTGSSANNGTPRSDGVPPTTPTEGGHGSSTSRSAGTPNDEKRRTKERT